MTDLSPATRAIWTAFKTANCDPYLVDPRKASLAAALRALAARINGADAIRQDILDIAAEMEGAP
jgi:tetrahydromethanopterin S-methyltransferase subunit C